jgi:hypothetical protein
MNLNPINLILKDKIKKKNINLRKTKERKKTQF